MIRQGKNTCSCLLQTFNSSKYGPLSLVLSHGRLNKITQPGLLFPLLLGLRYQHALTPTHTHPFNPPLFVKNIKAAKQVFKKLRSISIHFRRFYCELLPSSLLYGHLLFVQDPGFSQQWRMFLGISSARCSSSIKQVFPLTPSSLQNFGGRGGGSQ